VSDPRFLAPPRADGSRFVVLSDEEAHHAHRVLRLDRGDPVRVFDGVGHEWVGTIHEISAKRVTIAVDRAVETTPEPPTEVTLAVGLLKGDQMDTVVRESTMLGVAAIIPLVSARVVAPARARVEAARERWRRVAVQSSKQCGRAVIPIVRDPAGLEAVLTDATYDARVMLAEPGTYVRADRTLEPPRPRAGHERPRVLLLVGPEGGWTADEVRLAASLGTQLWRLGPRTMKAETAPTVALAALWTIWGWQ
jgi:16S rRNA (uracil1498-N3)-methyltransferase